MGELLDPIKRSFNALARGADPYVDYRATFRVTVLKQHPNLQRVDLHPEDPRLPPLSNIPLRIGVPGVEATFAPGHKLILAFENARPDRPYCVPTWEPGEVGTKPIKLTLHAAFLELGGPTTPLKDGVVTGQAIDSFTGMPMWMLGGSSAAVGARR